MRKWLPVFCATLVLIVAGCNGDEDENGLPAPGVDLAGAWNFSICGSPATAMLSQWDNAINGTVVNSEGEEHKIVGTVTGRDFSFTIILEDERDIVGDVTASQDEMSGSIVQAGATCGFTATRQ